MAYTDAMHTTLLIAALVGSLGVSYGPGVHVREADLYASLHPEWSEPDLQRFVRLGAVFPDLRSGGVALPVNSHARALGTAILAIAEADGEPWKVAFAHGYRLHTASDTVAQLMYLPWLNASSDLQQVNLFGRDGLGPVGDNELFIEGYGDLHAGDLQAFVDTAYAFLFEVPGELDDVIELFISGLAVVAGDDLDAAATRTSIDAFWGSVESTLAGLDPGFVAALLQEAHTLTVTEVIGLLSSGLFADLLGSVPGADGELVAEPHEMARLELHTAGASPSAFFGAYDASFASAGIVMLEDPGYDTWPWYRDAPIIAGILQGFALGRPGVWAHHPEVLLWGAHFEDAEGRPITAIGGEGPTTVTAVSELFRAFEGPPVEVSVEVVTRQGAGLVEAHSQAVVAETSGVVGYGPQRTHLSVQFVLEPGQLATTGYALRWRVQGDEAPFLESDWARYSVFADAPLFRASYAVGVQGSLATLEVEQAPLPGAAGWITGHTVLPEGHRGLAATVYDDSGLQVQGHPGGGFVTGALPPGPIVLRATADGYRGGPTSVDVVSGEERVARIDLRAVPRVTGPTWSPYASEASLVVDVAHFESVPSRVTVSLLRTADDGIVGGWSGAPIEEAVTLAFSAAQADGVSLRIVAQADEGESVDAGAMTIDASPPPSPEVTWTGPDCASPFEVQLTAADLHAPVDGYEVSTDEVNWQPIATTGVGSVVVEVVADVPVTLQARARNAAGLWSAVTTAHLCTLAGTSLPRGRGEVEGDAGAGSQDASVGVDAPVQAEAVGDATLPATQPGATPPETGCAAREGPTRPLRGGWPIALLILAVRALAQRDRARGGLLERA
jgi:hypothetical protein